MSGDLPDTDAPIKYHDEQIARAVLAHFLNLGTQTGSWALGSTFAISPPERCRPARAGRDPTACRGGSGRPELGCRGACTGWCARRSANEPGSLPPQRQNTAEQSKITARLASGSSIKTETLEKTWQTIVSGIEETKQIRRTPGSSASRTRRSWKPSRTISTKRFSGALK